MYLRTKLIQKLAEIDMEALKQGADSLFILLGGIMVLAVVRDGPYLAATAPFDPHAIRKILSSRGARLATFGYLGHMWELYAMWTWVAVFAAASLTASGMTNAGAAGSVAAFLAIGSGAAGCGLAGFLADRFGKACIAMWAMLASAACAALSIREAGVRTNGFLV